MANRAACSLPKGNTLPGRKRRHVCLQNLWGRPLCCIQIREMKNLCDLMGMRNTNPSQMLYARVYFFFPVSCQDPQKQLIIPTVKQWSSLNPSCFQCCSCKLTREKKILLCKSYKQPKSVKKGMKRTSLCFVFFVSLLLLVFFTNSTCLGRALK